MNCQQIKPDQEQPIFDQPSCKSSVRPSLQCSASSLSDSIRLIYPPTMVMLASTMVMPSLLAALQRYSPASDIWAARILFVQRKNLHFDKNFREPDLKKKIEILFCESENFYFSFHYVHNQRMANIYTKIH